MDKSFLNMGRILPMDESIDSEASFLNLSGSPRRRGTDFSFYEDSSLFGGDQSPPPLFKTRLPPAETSFLGRRSENTSTNQESGSGDRKPMEETEKHQKKLTNPPAIPEAPERNDPNQMEVQAEGGSLSMKQIMEAQMKDILEAVEALESHQDNGGAQLLAEAAAISEDVRAYKEKLQKIKEDYQAQLELASNILTK